MMFSCGVVKQQGRATDIADADTLLVENDSLRSVYLYTEGLKSLLLDNNPSGAVERFRKSLALDSLSAATYFQLAAAQVMTNADSALAYGEKAVALDTTNTVYRNQLGQILVLNGRYAEAMKLYEKLLAEDPQNPNNYRMLAALYDNDQQPFTAIVLLDSAEYKLGRIPELAAYKQQLLMDVKLYDRAINETLSLIDDDPFEVSNYVILGDLYSMTNKDSLAVVNYQKAMQLDSTNMQALASQLDFYHRHGRNMEYLSVMRKVFEADNIPVDAKVQLFGDITANTDYYRENYITINSLAELLQTKYSDNGDIVELYATHLIRSGKMDLALALYKTHIEAGHNDKESYYYVLDMESYLQRPDSVEKYVNQALALYPQSCELYMRKGVSEQNMNRTKEALKSYKEALKVAETDSVRSLVMTTIGDLYYSENNPKKCFAYYDKALRLDSDNASLLNNYAYFMSESGTVNEKTLAMSEKACQLTPNNATYLDTQGWILYLLGRKEEAKKIMRQAISFDKTNSSVLSLHYGDILFETGDHFMAEYYWKQALEQGYAEEEIRERLEKLNGK